MDSDRDVTGKSIEARTAGFEEQSLERKRRELIALRDQLREAVGVVEAAEVEIRAQSSAGAFEREDEAQRLDNLEGEGLLARRDLVRLVQVERELQELLETPPDATETSSQGKAVKHYPSGRFCDC